MVNPDSFEDLYSNACSVLKQEEVQNQVAHLFAVYLATVHPIAGAAAVQNGGERPQCLENEVYSCFHHIARGICCKVNISETCQEVRKGEDSHLKRLLLDAYKIAIRPQLKEYRFIVEELYHLSLDKEFNPAIYGEEPIKKVAAILKIKTRIKNSYEKAKRSEALGDCETAIEAFADALANCYELAYSINALMDLNVIVIAKAHMARKNAEKQAAESQRLKEREEDKRENRDSNWWSRAIAIAALLVSVLSWLIPGDRERDDNTTFESAEKAIPVQDTLEQ